MMHCSWANNCLKSCAWNSWYENSVKLKPAWLSSLDFTLSFASMLLTRKYLRGADSLSHASSGAAWGAQKPTTAVPTCQHPE